MQHSSFRRRHPGFIAAFTIVVLTLLAVDTWVIYKRVRYENEISRLRAGMSEFERRRSDAITSSKERQFQMMMELVRRQAKVAKEIHLAISIDSARMFLEEEGALLREIPVEVGPERRVGAPPDTVHIAIPRGTRSVARVLGADDSWEVPAWVYTDRKLPVPDDRTIKGALGPVAIVLDGGTVIYSMPTVGPLNDSTYVLPGSIRASAEDLRAVVPNLTRGAAVYFY